MGEEIYFQWAKKRVEWLFLTASLSCLPTTAMYSIGWKVLF